jgi:hypothetical protein
MLVMEAMVLSAASSTPLFVASVQMLFLAIDGVRFVVAAMLLHVTSIYRASHHLLTLA